MNNLERLLSTRGLVQQSPTTEDIRTRSKLVTPDPMRVFYGETYDDIGHPIDSLKYYFFVSFLAEALSQEGANAKPIVLVADTAACRNVGERHQQYYMSLGKDRAEFIERVNGIYRTGLHVVKMSDYVNSSEFIAARERIMDVCKADPELMVAVEKTVPESKVDVEREKGFMYSFDEITTIVDLDVKVGPPREDLYDEVARRVAAGIGKRGLMSLFLTPTFPLGMNWAYFFANEGIEDHGITAYKAGSKRLQANRILVERSNPDYIRELIATSFISTNPAVPNPVLDIGIISDMARIRLEESSLPITLADDFYSGKVSETALRDRVTRNVEEFVLSRFKND